ncbi:hypothetical protein OIE62_05845 [Streptomyces scopuliridis]|uniref:Uncharacterized protein n=1 Tax=Streptomyces scopuliridis TaxID=452529 RepID=A0ACD4ZVD7_9ACTN|nr:hypothetical protein [Streptomyces scopuliridis]WSB37263.1 hypothetical protein OG949_33400 [Streptomyces scopuliridis]WSC01884.1 hypothetical protein OG835_35980 [Streptomyces scopuliridis]WSC04579.1 hypothetical protein OIE62_05845 [Streptomyces scopuliridis]
MSPETLDPDPRSDGAALELLVHGVGGATPQKVLDDPRTVRITGDETAAVYRRADDVDAEAHPERYQGRPVPEAYCWSNLTSGNGSRALWLLLLPFMVVNLAHWMRPATKGLGRSQRLYGVLVRLVALTLTVLLTAAACEVALDLTAWQCAGSARCVADRSWLGFLSPERHGWWSQPGRRLALAAVVPTALVVLLWYLSNRTWSAYEAQRPPTDEPPAGTSHAGKPEATHEAPGTEGAADEGRAASDDPVTVRPALGRPGFWYGRRLVARLRAAHTAAGFLTIAAALTAAATDHDRSTDGGPLGLLGLLLQATLAGCAAVVLWVVCSRGRSERKRDGSLDQLLISALPATALGALAVAVVYAAWSRPGWVSTGGLPGNLSFLVLALAQIALIVVLVVTAHVLHRRAPHPRIAMRGLGGPAVAMLACALGGVMTGGVAQRVADWLDGDATPGAGEGAIVGPPVLLSWQASVIPVLLVLLLIPVAVLGFRTLRAARRLAPLVEREYGKETPDPLRTRQVAGARARAALTDYAPRLVGVVSGASLLLGAGAVAGSWLSGQVPGVAAEGTDSFVESVADTAQSIGSWLVGLGFLLFVTWGRRAYRDASARRTIGILWDVGTFWPRAAHPFAPPCYAERAVPDLTWRIVSWTGRTGGRLVLSGHSQGSVLAAAAVWQLRTATRHRVALLTYGSPLERLYGRWFPAYFGAEQLGQLSKEVHCWRNLWRSTDPIGGPVRVPEDGDRPEVDRGPLKDPLAYSRTVLHPLPEPILGHSDYQADPVFAEERAALLDRLPPAAVPAQRTEKEAQGQRAQGSSGRSSA